jgi:CRISPR-associated endonuclease/helicase Cas3
MKFPELLAKSQLAGLPLLPEQILPGHLAQVLGAGDQLMVATGKSQLHALGLDPANHLDRFRNLVRLAAVLHDLGKANSHFQEMVRKSRKAQGLRHEWVSVLMVIGKLQSWLEQVFSQEDVRLALWAVAGHHPSWTRPSPPEPQDNGAGPSFIIFWDHKHLAESLQLAKVAFGLGEPPIYSEEVYSLTGSSSVFIQLKTWFRKELGFWERMAQSDRLLLAGLKHSLVGADVAGSALPVSKPLSDAEAGWIISAFANQPEAQGLESVVKLRLGRSNPRAFQSLMGESTASITLVTAGCGSGKTVGAFLWAARCHPGKKLFFCYPTTGTATEGFRGYLHVNDLEDLTAESKAVKGLQSDLFHSRRDIDFAFILGTDPDPDEWDNNRVEALKAWSTPVVACTCDTVLGVVQNHRKGMFAWPGIAGSAIVFDEVHAFDDRLFGALLRFLNDVQGVPVLLMTASLPDGRLTAIRRLAKERNRSIREFEGPRDVEMLLRYRLEKAPEDLEERVRVELEGGGKILWVSNTVKRVMEVADQFPKAIVYHSRFKYIDRVQRHREVVGAFEPRTSTKPVLACCTQVAEMSLDLKGCTLLVTDIAPVPSMIQRLGRLNRDAGPGSPIRPFIVLETTNSLPYDPEHLAEARVWLKRLADRPLCQRDLVTEWKAIEKMHEPLPITSTWLDGGPRTQPGELREASPGITVLLDSDRILLESSREEPGFFSIPMPTPPQNVDWRTKQYRGIPVVRDETIHYDIARGARWVI